MTSRARPRLVGLFVIGGVILAMGVIVMFTSGRLFRDVRSYVVFFPHAVGGLKPGAAVTFRQIPVGEVSEVELVLTGKTAVDMQIMAVIHLDRPVRRLSGTNELPSLSDKDMMQLFVDAGLRASIRSSSPVAGQKSVDLDFHPDLEARYSGVPHRYPEIPTAPTGMEVLSEKVESTLKQLTDVPIDEVLLQLQSTLRSAQGLLDSGDVRGAMANLRATLETANRALAGVEKTMGNVDGMVTDVRSTLGNTDESVTSLKSTLDQANRTLATLDRNIERTAEVEYEATRSLDELNELLKSLRGLIDVLQQQPEALLRGKAEPREED